MGERPVEDGLSEMRRLIDQSLILPMLRSTIVGSVEASTQPFRSCWTGCAIALRRHHKGDDRHNHLPYVTLLQHV
jgi:hypothetical protein